MGRVLKGAKTITRYGTLFVRITYTVSVINTLLLIKNMKSVILMPVFSRSS
jgi:hypothetical protein